MTLFAAISTGFLIGLSVVMPVGPMSLLCVQRTLAFGVRAGLLTGAGAATITVGYGGLIIAGLGAASPVLEQGRHVLGAAGGLVLLGLSARTLLRSRAPMVASGAEALPAGRAFVSAALFNVTNPMGPLLMLAALSSAAVMQTASIRAEVAALAGIFLGAICWWACLSSAVGMLRAWVSPAALRWLNIAAGALLSIYGVLTLSRALER